jgi:hypothetical protein
MKSRPYYINKENGYIRQGMPLRAPGESEELIAAAKAKRARRAAKRVAGEAKAAETRQQREELLKGGGHDLCGRTRGTSGVP